MTVRRMHSGIKGFVLVVWCLWLCTTAWAQVITLDRPGEREFIVDRADLITPEDEQRIRQICDTLLTDTASPIIVVTIESMAKYTQRNIQSIESFAKILFDQWGIGHLTVEGRALNTGILLLVARDDRKVRIELGIGWEYEKEAAAQQVMDTVIVPRFRAGDFSGGISAGVEALEQMVRRGPAAVSGGGAAPSAAQPPSPFPASGGGSSLIGCGGFGIVFIIIAVFIVARMMGRMLGGFGGRRPMYGGYSRGRPGMGTGLLTGLLLGQMLGGRRSGGFRGGGFGGGGGGFGGGGFGGGFGGGSFGGGFSGGRGASGSW